MNAANFILVPLRFENVIRGARGMSFSLFYIRGPRYILSTSRYKENVQCSSTWKDRDIHFLCVWCVFLYFSSVAWAEFGGYYGGLSPLPPQKKYLTYSKYKILNLQQFPKSWNFTKYFFPEILNNDFYSYTPNVVPIHNMNNF